MGDIIALVDHFNLSPLNTVLLAGLAFFIRWSVKNIVGRIERIERRDRQQDIAIARLEERLDIQGERYIEYRSDEER